MEGTVDKEARGSSHGMILPLKKRPLNDQGPVESSSEEDGGGESLEFSPEENGSVDGGESSVPSSTAATPKEHADHNPMSPAAVTDMSEKLGKFMQKAKWVALLPEASPAPPPPPPVAEKLMGDAIRSSAASTARARRAPGSAAAERTTTEQEEGVFSAAVQRRLDELRATPTFLLHKKMLNMSDVSDDQNRLLVSCKGAPGGRDGCAITQCLSRAEMKRVDNIDVGLLVPAMDQNGVGFTLMLKFLTSNGGYRFISKGWKAFKKRNGLVLNADKRWTRDVELEVRAFRSHKLRRQPPLKEGKLHEVKDPNTGKVKKDGGLELEIDHHLHQDGGLGVILLHHEHTKKRVKREEDDGDNKDEAGPSSPRLAVPCGKSKRKQQQQHDNNKRDGVAVAVAQRAEALANTADAMSKEEMDAEFGEVMSNAAMGLLLIAGIIPKEQGQEQEEKETEAA